MLAGVCACLAVSERAASILPRRLCRSPQHTGGPMTGCGTERYADWFFDLDGTLVDSAPDILRLLGGVLREEGLASCPNWTRAHRAAQEDIIRGICPDLAPADLERIVRIYRARYRACPFDESPAFPGIPLLFERLSGRGCRLFVATNKPEDVTRRLLDARGLLPYLTGFACSDSVPGDGSPRPGCWPCSWSATAWSRGRRLWSGTRRLTCGEGRRRGWPRLRPCTGMGGAGRCSKPGRISLLRMRRGRAWSGCPAEPPVCMKEGLHEAGKSASGHSLCRDAARVRFHRIAG